MSATLELRAARIAVAAGRHAPSRRYWAMVGNGPNLVAAKELRIKLSELCYKSIACDVTEDKKHIDLSSEPMILVCAAGLTGSNADDVAKEVAIFRAHKAAPIVIATEGEHRFSAALEVIGRARGRRPSWPSSCPPSSATCSATRRPWPSTPRPGRCGRPGAPSRATSARRSAGPATDDWFQPVRSGASPPSPGAFFDGLRAGSYNGHLEASTATRLAALLRFATGTVPIEAYQQRVRQGRHPRCRGRGPRPGPDRRPSRS